jgi:hypothetical protein
MRKALLLATLTLAASPGCMWISLRFDPTQLPPIWAPATPPVAEANTPATFQHSPPEPESANESAAEPERPGNSR